MRVLALSSYPLEAAATRFRLYQFVRPLAERGITLNVRPFLDSRLFADFYARTALPRTAFGLAKSAALRLRDVVAATRSDVVLVQREAMLFGPPFIEWLVTRFCDCPLVLDLDDATYVSYHSPTYGRLAKALKWFSKTDDLISWATVVTCGNRAIAEYVESKGAHAKIIPTVVDTELFRPSHSLSTNGVTIGWIGTHSTFPYLESLFPVLQQLAQAHKFRLKIVGAGKDKITIPGVEVENLEWKLDREVMDFQSFDIGLYPIVEELYANQWAAGKSGFKAIQYMAVGIPYVASPVGAIKEIGEINTTHFLAATDEEWRSALMRLITDRAERERMGAAGRRHALAEFNLPDQAAKLAAVLREASTQS
jgi:glycosyltransferase involved in cell wall biosynthesis